MGPVRGDAGRCARCRPPRGQALAAGAADPPEDERRPRSATAFFVLAWDTFRAPVFDYDEALRLARAVGVDLDRNLTGRLAHKSGSNLMLWDSVRRAATGSLGPADGSRSMIDALHHAASVARSKSLRRPANCSNGQAWTRTPGSLRRSKRSSKCCRCRRPSPASGSRATRRRPATTSRRSYKLSRLAYSDQVAEPDQLTLWRSGSE